MGIIKMAALGGAGIWAVKQLRNEHEKERVQQQQMNHNNGQSRNFSDGKSIDMSGSGSNPPAYSNQYAAEYYAGHAPENQQQQQYPVQQMNFIDPRQNQRAVENVSYSSTRQQPDTSSNNELIEKAMSLMAAGQQDQARQVLASIAGKK